MSDSELQVFYVDNHPWTVRYLSFATGDQETARDLAQRVWMKFLAYSRRRPLTSPRAVLRIMASDAVAEWCRRPVKDRVLPAGLAPAGLAPVPGGQDGSDARWDLQAALLTLPPDLREALLLRYYADLPPGEVARILDIPLPTLKSRLAAARAALRKAPSLAGYQVTTGGIR
ncbi:sigma-70 family RNA polymerase sigma factor [Longispora albida]|uniref:sigma-70 family RNA polymerase sigma factor n=1 Tax=Longispora albida TaxID=203523 RepID=UPI00039A8CD9|nr:RNA polymerase sigma factor [Longispora albida]